jgi:hypothetical protein
MHQQLWGYKVEEKLYLGVREQKRLNTTALSNQTLPSSFLISGYQGNLSAEVKRPGREADHSPHLVPS